MLNKLWKKMIVFLNYLLKRTSTLIKLQKIIESITQAEDKNLLISYKINKQKKISKNKLVRKNQKKLTSKNKNK